MAERSSGTPKLDQDPLIEKLVPDASQVPDVRVLVGFLGKSTRQGYWRLYLTPTLNDYVEFAQDDVKHSHSLASDKDRLGGTVVWIKRAANVQHTRSVSREAQADFLQGAITAALSTRGGRRGLFWPAFAPQPPVQQVFLSFEGHANSCVSDICNNFMAPSFLAGGDVLCTFNCND